MKIRLSRIVDAHRKTFDQIFSAQALPFSDCRAKIQLYIWLRQDNKIFWISGKPGSGKSTLMKYLDGKDRTQSALLKWAGNTRLVRVSFYFWNSGTEMQKSLQGLLQSLLFSVLSECPALVPLACTGRWSGQHPSVSLDQPWSLLELQQAFRVLKQQTFISVCFYFHIDGLDEYSGDHSNVIENFQDLTASASACIKICASSRPQNCFKDAFGKDTNRKLYLQDLTREDIKLFAREKLADHAVSKGILQDKDFLYQELIEEIVERAHGVFLWVFLAVHSLRKGIRNGDTASLLKKRLYSLPTELEPFFEHILNSVDGMYQERMACAFLVAFRAPKPLDIIQYSFLDEEDPEYTISLPFQRVSKAEIHFRVANTHRRINSRYC